MKKIRNRKASEGYPCRDSLALKKLFRMARFTVFCFFICLTQVMALESYSQKTRLSLTVNNKSLENVLETIEDKTEYFFLYNRDLIDVEQKVDIDVENKSIKLVLDDLLKDKDINYSVYDRQIVLTSTKAVLGMSQQLISIKGMVSNTNGGPIPGVTVFVKGTTQGTTTDVDGNYSIRSVPADAVLVFSFVGMKTKEIVVAGQTQINVSLDEETIGLNEVVAIGYGTQRRREVSGSVASVKIEDLKERPVATILQKMQGQVAGVQINQTTGIPGGGTSIRIRGAASVSASNRPLYVVDGFPIVGSLNSINPNEIEDISILKGTAASSLYGSRAANGVVLITTKQAKEGNPVKLEVDLTAGVGFVPENLKPDVLDAKGFVTHLHYLWEDRVKYQGYSPDAIPEIFRDPDAYSGPDTDWYDELLRTSEYRNVNVTLSSGTGKVRTSNVASIHDEKGTVLNTKYQRFSLRSNNVFEVNDNLSAGINIAPTFILRDGSTTDGAYNILFNAITTPPIFDPDELGPDGEIVGSFPNNYSPIWRLPNPKKRLLETTNVSKTIRLLANAFVKVKFLKDFEFSSNFSGDITASQHRIYNPSDVGSHAWAPPPRVASASESRVTEGSWAWENMLRYKKTINENHHIEALAVYSSQEYKWDRLRGFSDTFADDEITYVGSGTNKTTDTGVTAWSLASALGRVNYNYKGKYLLSAAFRRDGSSRFGEDNRWGTFPSVSLGWILSEEEFMKNFPAVSFMKIRAERGKSGNFSIGNYTHLGGVAGVNYVIDGSVVEGRRQNSLGNSSLTWETTVGTGVGLDLGLLNDRFTFTFDYYRKNTDGLLYQINIPRGTGFSDIRSNIGEFRFWGYEFSATSRNLVGDFKWTTSFNISFDRNKTIKLGTNNAHIGGGGGYSGQQTNKTEVGQPVGQFWGWVFDGVYDNQEELDSEPKGSWNEVGSAKFLDLDGDGIVEDNEDDRTFLGNPQPDFIFGMTNDFSYKNWDLSISIAGSYGNEMMYGFYEWTTLLEGLFNVEKWMLDRWRSPENPGSGRVPGTATGRTDLFRRIHSGNISDGSYLAIKNISLGYDLPGFYKIIKKARVYASVQNAYVFTNYPGVNPEATNLNGIPNGIDGGNYPIPRTYVLGLNVTF